MLANAILAVVSQYLSITQGIPDTDSAGYHSKSLQMLIPFLDDPLLALDENLLAAIVILRLYEERLGECAVPTFKFLHLL